MENLNIFISKGKIMASRIGMGALVLIFCLLFYLAWVNEWSWASVIPMFDHLFVLVVFGIFIAGFGFGFYWMLFRLDGSKPVLILENDGYIDNVGLLKGRKILYKDIERFEDKTVNMNRSIVVYLKDVDAFLDAQTGIKKKLLSSTYKQVGSPLSVPARGFDYKFEDLLAELNKRLAASR